ncbi:UNVERIFIED_CONTAM: hypothetical protein Slati_4252100 [Sesamum latifolium]|uniref:Reverse transcriptase zinc-binding domain-containing protein n=1 Tax=Sesamum latifolium TaxID=2727402 RepID=A0AAW2TCG6_9LAMI
MPLGHGTTDTLVWHRSKKGKFSVRAAYNLGFDVSRIDSGGPSRMDPNRDLEFIWKAKVVARVKLFGWKACSNAIPTIHNLLKRKVSISTKCPQCYEEFEDVKNCLMLCDAAWITCALSDLEWCKINVWSNNCENWMRDVQNGLDTDKFQWFLKICWALWNRRCKKLAEGESEDSLQLTDRTRRYFAAFKEANGKQAKSSGVSKNARWNSPSTGKF